MCRIEILWTLALVCAVSIGCGPKPAEPTADTPPEVTLPADETAPPEPTADPAATDAPPPATEEKPAKDDEPADEEKKPAKEDQPAADSPPAAGPALGNPAPEDQSKVSVEITDYNGVMAHIRQQSGKVVVVDAWSTFCDECLDAFPGLVALHKKYGPEKVACVSLSFDYASGDVQDVVPGVMTELERLGATFTNFVSNESDEVLYQKFGFSSVPAVFVYDQQGMLVKRFDNSNPNVPTFNYTQIDGLVADLLAGKDPAP